METGKTSANSQSFLPEDWDHFDIQWVTPDKVAVSLALFTDPSALAFALHMSNISSYQVVARDPYGNALLLVERMEDVPNPCGEFAAND